jgi:hypothetical protein
MLSAFSGLGEDQTQYLSTAYESNALPTKLLCPPCVKRKSIFFQSLPLCGTILGVDKCTSAVNYTYSVLKVSLVIVFMSLLPGAAMYFSDVKCKIMATI